jgi:carbon storage regulator
MLVLSRRQGESLVIDGDIEVTVLSLEGGRVRLGIRAPEGIRIDRAEVHHRLAAEALPSACRRSAAAG